MNTNLKLSLDTRRPKKDNSYPIILRLTHFRKTTSISLGKSIPQEFWDDQKEKVKKGYKAALEVNKFNKQLWTEKVKALDVIENG